MIQYSIRRILASFPVLLGILIATFVLARLIPGDPCKAILGEKATQEVCAQFAERYGLNKPIYVQLGIYMGNVLRGDFGTSIRFSRPVTTILVERLPTTVELGLAAMTIALLVGIPAGIISAIKRNSILDVVTMVGANIGVSMPVYWLGLMLAYLFALVLKDTPFWLPPSGRLSPGVTVVPFFQVFGWPVPEAGFWRGILDFIARLYLFNSLITGNWTVFKDALTHLILPALALSTIPMSIIARMTRSSMLEVLRLDYIRTARAKGLIERLVILKHALRNALLPIVTVVGIQVGNLFAGAVLTETIFGLAGVGSILFEAITARDFPIIQAFTVVIAIGYVIINLLVDLSYVFIDPRIRLE
ncbi:peptide ABC transporter permease [Thermanaerothrix daxensis]|uniref:Peptide ABC transporter permease n=1 Tax=Thermanaerothrix daxensis TaxID=869279 RepID=A0A0P6Y0H3_9CHLR|nr:ABC transporter permease [Thermanaerothrix daxensis]KPL82423.1 peptide ABC transporter permease [Thermanaerothrix daxensis]